jgi:hypothetical protein
MGQLSDPVGILRECTFDGCLDPHRRSCLLHDAFYYKINQEGRTESAPKGRQDLEFNK